MSTGCRAGAWLAGLGARFPGVARIQSRPVGRPRAEGEGRRCVQRRCCAEQGTKTASAICCLGLQKRPLRSEGALEFGRARKPRDL